MVKHEIGGVYDNRDPLNVIDTLKLMQLAEDEDILDLDWRLEAQKDNLNQAIGHHAHNVDIGTSDHTWTVIDLYGADKRTENRDNVEDDRANKDMGIGIKIAPEIKFLI